MSLVDDLVAQLHQKLGQPLLFSDVSHGDLASTSIPFVLNGFRSELNHLDQSEA